MFRNSCSYSSSEVNSPYPSLDERSYIISDRKKLELCQIKSCDSKNPKEHQKYLEGKKQYKKTIKDKRNLFFRKALSSKNPKSVSNSIDRTLNKQQQKKKIMNHLKGTIILANLQQIFLAKKVMKVTFPKESSR